MKYFIEVGTVFSIFAFLIIVFTAIRRSKNKDFAILSWNVGIIVFLGNGEKSFFSLGILFDVFLMMNRAVIVIIGLPGTLLGLIVCYCWIYKKAKEKLNNEYAEREKHNEILLENEIERLRNSKNVKEIIGMIRRNNPKEITVYNSAISWSQHGYYGFKEHNLQKLTNMQVKAMRKLINNSFGNKYNIKYYDNTNWDGTFTVELELKTTVRSWY